MDSESLQSGFHELEKLARAEYRQSLAEIASDPDPETAATRLGRLVGVMLKEPFAEPHSLSEPSGHTKAFRSWHLKDPSELGGSQVTESWQFKALDLITQDPPPDAAYLKEMTVPEVVYDAGREGSLFGCFAGSLRKYICGDPEIRKKVEEALRIGGTKLPMITPETIVAGGGLTLGGLLVQSIPVLGLVGAPVIAAIVLILYTLGINAFCKWSEDRRD